MNPYIRSARAWLSVLAATALGAVSSACVAPTGDWRDDSIGFSPRLAESRLNVQRRELAAAQRGTDSAVIEQATLRQQVRTAQSGNASKRVLIEKLRARKADAERELAAVQAQLGGYSGDAELIAKRDALVRERNELNQHILFLLDNQ